MNPRAAVYRGFGVDAMWIPRGEAVGRALGEGKAKPCYTVFALSDLAVSGGLALKKQVCLAQISPSPYSVNP